MDPSITVVTSDTRCGSPTAGEASIPAAAIPLASCADLSSSSSFRVPSVVLSPSVVCPGLAEAISADNALFFQEEIACAVGQTSQQRVKRADKSSSGRTDAGHKDAATIGGATVPSSVVSPSVRSSASAASDLPSTPTAFFLHKIQSEIRRKHDFSLAWGDNAGSNPHAQSVRSEAVDCALASSSGDSPSACVSAASSVCAVCHSSAHGSCVCPFARRSVVECAECFAPMSAAQLSVHLQPVASLLSQYQAAAVASKIALPAEWRSAPPDQRVCPHAFMQKHFAQYAWPYAADSGARATDAIAAASSASGGPAARGSAVAHSTVSDDLAIFAGAAATASDTSGSSSSGGRVASDALPWPAASKPVPAAVPLTRTGSVHHAASDPLSSIIEQQHGITLSDELSDTDNAAPGDSPHARVGQAVSTSPRVPPAVSAPGEEFPPNCEACHEEMHSFTQFLNHMQVCPAM